MSIKLKLKNNVIKGNTKIGNNSKITEGFNSESTISINNSDNQRRYLYFREFRNINCI